jgi:hypothetical protein
MTLLTILIPNGDGHIAGSSLDREALVLGCYEKSVARPSFSVQRSALELPAMQFNAEHVVKVPGSDGEGDLSVPSSVWVQGRESMDET